MITYNDLDRIARESYSLDPQNKDWYQRLETWGFDVQDFQTWFVETCILGARAMGANPNVIGTGLVMGLEVGYRAALELQMRDQVEGTDEEK